MKLPKELRNAPKFVQNSYTQSRSIGAFRVSDDDAFMRVGANSIIVLMRQQNIKLPDLAKKVGLSATSLSDILSNPTKSTLATLVKITKALNKMCDING